MTTPYARFFKADLHLQTPVDRRHWRGAQLPQAPDQADLTALAEAYARRCYEVGLELIAITEHNFAGGVDGSLIPFVRAAIQSLASEFGYEIVVFPGFEVTGPIGRGAHLICLFDPATPLAHVDAKLTALGLPPNARFRDGEPVAVPTAEMTFDRMLRLIQDDSSIPGICFAAHPNDAGVLDRETVEQWWSQEVIKNNSLLCMELQRAREEYVVQPGTRLVKSILLNADPRYERNHPIAAIRNSDAKALREDAENQTNYIGFRHSWLKMSEHSIEGLRQAFLDHESRIRFGDKRPEDGYAYPRIRRLEIRSTAFLVDQEIDFIPNMNTLIGGGGTGKSTIIEYLRLLLQQAEAITGTEARANFEKIRRTIDGSTELEVEIERDGQTWTLRSEGGGRSGVIAGADIPNLPKFFPARFFSQREIYAIAESREARANILDNLIRDELDAYARDAEVIIHAIKQLDEEVLERAQLHARLRDTQTQRLALATKLDSLKQLDEPLTKWRILLSEREFVDGLKTRAEEAVSELATKLDEVAEAAAEVPAIPNEWTHRELLERLGARFRGAWNEAQESIAQALERFKSSVERITASGDVVEWRNEYETAEREYAELRDHLAQEGADPDQYLAYERQLRELDREIAVSHERLEALEGVEEERARKVDELRGIWAKETEARRAKARALQDAIPQTSANNPFVEIQVEAYGDDEAFKGEMEGFLRDRRRISEDDWHSLLDSVNEETQSGHSPTRTFVEWMTALRSGDRPSGFPWGLGDRRTEVLTQWCDVRACSAIELIRVPDKLTVTLYRDDGSRAGELEGDLSVGQRSTAVLTLLLAHDDAPAVIDQPEDEVDNEFTYRQLVPLLRRVKEERQLRISTHDPNLPVNGDAELIYALEARDGRGRVKDMHGVPAVGALDRKAVREAVEDIMEGSEEAFRRRYEKYGF